MSAELGGLRIAHVSDPHFRRWSRLTEAAQDLLLTLEYDLLVVTGDFGTTRGRWPRAADMIRRFFEPIAKRAPIYGVLGNHDDPGFATAPDMPLTFLRNESVPIQYSGSALELAGVQQTLPEDEDLDAALGSGLQVRPTILLAHYPSTVLRLPPGRVDLLLSGHTHGGQIRFPYLGCLWTNDRISTRLARGLHVVSGVLLHISPGIGVSPPIPVRINCPPEVSILTIQPAERSPRQESLRQAITSATG